MGLIRVACRGYPQLFIKQRALDCLIPMVILFKLVRPILETVFRRSHLHVGAMGAVGEEDEAAGKDGSAREASRGFVPSSLLKVDKQP